jgi:PAS domain S-box-containing protein
VFDVNQSLLATLGYAKDELIGRKVSELLAPDTEAHVRINDNVAQILNGTMLTEPRTLISKGGDKIYTVAQMGAVQTAQSSDAMVFVSFVDVSANESLKTALFDREQSFQQLIELVPQQVFILDVHGNISWTNGRPAEYLGAANMPPPDSLNSLRNFVHPEDLTNLNEYRRHSLQATGQIEPLELRFLRHDGEYRWFLMDTRQIKNSAGELIMLISTAVDIHDRKLQAQRTLTLQKLESIGQLTGGLAHDFNNLLSLIIGNLDLLQDDVASDKGRKRLGVAMSAAERGAALVKSLLALASKQVLHPKSVDLGATLQVMEPLILNALGPRVNYTCKLPEEALVVMVDENGLTAALLNLVVNARDAMPDGGTLVVVLEHYTPDFVRQAAAASLARITVKDTGSGMSDSVRLQALEPFFTTKAQGAGTGLGLAMVAGFVKQSMGEVRIDSAPGQGCTVAIYLPLVQADATDAVDTQPAHLQLNGVGSILVVDDEVELAALTAEWLRDGGYTVTVAGSAVDALQRQQHSGFDLVITDIAMPGPLDGLELAERMQAQWPHTPVLLISGYSAETASRRGTLPWPLLVKPYRRPELLAAVQERLIAMPQPPAAGHAL